MLNPSPQPADFAPREPFHPKLKIVTQQSLVARSVRLAQAGQKEAATDLIHAMLRALHYPLSVVRESIDLKIVALPPAPDSGGAS